MTYVIKQKTENITRKNINGKNIEKSIKRKRKIEQMKKERRKRLLNK